MKIRFLIFSICLLTITFALAGNAKAERPNIVYILADDLGYGDLTCYGQKVLKTPRLDQMAASGIRFTQHYAGSTVCAPSRCVFLTGLHTGHASVRGNHGGNLRKNDITIPSVLKQAGYRTGCVGKWGVGSSPALDDPNQHGFEEFFGYISMWHAHNFYPEFLIENGKKFPLRNEVSAKWKTGDGRGVATKKVDYVPDLVTERALQFIEKNQQHPFFLYIALNVPHANNEGRNKGMEVPSYGEFAAKDWPEPEKGFASMIGNIDRDVGEVLDKLHELKLEKNTLVIFSSDNGPHQEGGHQMDFFDSNGPYRGKKRDLYEGGIRVPMIAYWPGKIAPGKTSAHASGFQDLFPTFCEVAGIDAPKTDGISFLPTLLGNSSQPTHDFFYWEFHEQGGRQAVIKGDWKGVRLNVQENPDGPIELYDLSKDPGETTNIADQHSELVKEMSAIMQQEHVEPAP